MFAVVVAAALLAIALLPFDRFLMILKDWPMTEVFVLFLESAAQEGDAGNLVAIGGPPTFISISKLTKNFI